MNVGGVLFVFVGFAMVAGLIIFAAGSSPIQVVDSNGNTYTSVGNTTNDLVNNVTATGGAATGGLLLVLAALAVISAVGFMVIYSKSR